MRLFLSLEAVKCCINKWLRIVLSLWTLLRTRNLMCATLLCNFKTLWRYSSSYKSSKLVEFERAPTKKSNLVLRFILTFFIVFTWNSSPFECGISNIGKRLVRIFSPCTRADANPLKAINWLRWPAAIHTPT